jgi:hypothetical protein
VEENKIENKPEQAAHPKKPQLTHEPLSRKGAKKLRKAYKQELKQIAENNSNSAAANAIRLLQKEREDLNAMLIEYDVRISALSKALMVKNVGKWGWRLVFAISIAGNLLWAGYMVVNQVR